MAHNRVEYLKKLSNEMSILYVEDEAEVRIQFTHLLGKFFTVVECASNGVEGIELYAKNQYDLVITDLSMPKMNGEDLISRIHAINPHQKIIVISAHSESEKLIDLINLGVDSFLIKPISFDKMVDELVKQCEIHSFDKAIDTANRQLSDSQLLLQSIFDQSKDGIALLDYDTKFLFFNNAYIEMIGYDTEELLRKKCIDLTAPEDLERSSSAIQKTIEDGVVENFEKTCIRKDGKKIIVSMSIVLMRESSQFLITARDITEAKKIEKRLSDYHLLIDDNIITSSTDFDGRITYASNAFCTISGYSKEELIGSNHSIVKDPDMDPKVYQKLWQTISSGQVWEGEMRNKKKNGEMYWVKASIYPVFNDESNMVGYTSIRTDITDKKRIEELSITDALTTLFNRRHFNEMFPRFLKSALRNNEIVCFLMIDIDYFKLYNDTYGHQEGDNVLEKVSGVIKSSFKRADDLCFRLGGEEFAVLFKTIDFQKAFEFANDLCKNVEKLQIVHEKNESNPFVTVSMGKLCIHPSGIVDTEALYKRADELLYKAKKEGRNRVISDCMKG